eukprot:m.67366 g.67366  ORF g.67366 m.67366 type:complete len:83 (+) comp8431_c0_seq2:1146-1394(+)
MVARYSRKVWITTRHDDSGVEDEVQALYNLELSARANTSNPIYDDLSAIFKQLYAVTSNGPNTIGGGGNPVVPPPPDLCPPY